MSFLATPAGRVGAAVVEQCAAAKGARRRRPSAGSVEHARRRLRAAPSPRWSIHRVPVGGAVAVDAAGTQTAPRSMKAMESPLDAGVVVEVGMGSPLKGRTAAAAAVAVGVAGGGRGCVGGRRAAVDKRLGTPVAAEAAAAGGLQTRTQRSGSVVRG